MTLLTGLTEAGVEVPVQVKPDGRLVAEGLTGPVGPAGSVGPAGPVGPAGAAGFYAWRNILINGDLRINQRGVTIAAAAVGEYGPDRWKKASAGTMTQVVEDVNYIPNTVYTLSGTGVTTQQLTSPSSGHWTMPAVPITATNIQLEPGTVATPFERRSYGLELALCQRYYYKIPKGKDFTYPSNAAAPLSAACRFVTTHPVSMRVRPTVVITGGTLTDRASTQLTPSTASDEYSINWSGGVEPGNGIANWTGFSWTAESEL